MSKTDSVHDRPSVSYIVLRSRQVDETMSDDPNLGGWGITTSRVFFSYGYPTTAEWPLSPQDLPSNWPPNEPAGLDDLAHRRRSEFHVRVRSANDCEEMLARQYGVSIDIKVTASWRSPQMGRVKYDPEVDGILGSHSVALVTRRFAKIAVPIDCIPFVNSWGSHWGTGGWGYIHRSDLDQMLLEGWARPPTYAKEQPRSKAKVRLITQQFRITETITLHRFVLVDPRTDRRIAWLIAVARDGWFDAEDLFVLPEYRRQGYGSYLLGEFLEGAERLRLPHRLFVPFADWNDASRQSLEAFFGQERLFIALPGVQWAAALVSRDASAGLPPVNGHATPTYSLVSDLANQRRKRFEDALSRTNRDFGRALKRLAE
jgi:GNAT superfamily N-acetyltransferase